MKKKTADIGTRDPLMIANYLLRKAKREGKQVTPLQLIKLVYIAHGWFMAFFDKPLLRESVQAWKYGPVVPSVYHAVKKYGRDPIEGLLPGVADLKCLKEEETQLLDEVWRVYGKFSGVQLSSLTHQKGTPWHQVWDGTLFEDIPDKLIKEYYLAKKDS